MNEQLSELIQDIAERRFTPDELARAGWQLFDLVSNESDPSRALRLAEDGAEEIGRARGIKANSMGKYRQRGRDLLRYRDKLTVMPRIENPLSIVARLRNPRPKTNHALDVDVTLINAILNANGITQRAVIELVESGRLRGDGLEG